MKKILYTFTHMLLGLFTLIACTNPVEDINLALSSNLFSQTIVIQAVDASGQENLLGSNTLEVEVLDPNDYIYNQLGEKDFSMEAGFLTLFVDPNVDMEEINFKVKISGENYLTTIVPVQVTSGQTMKSVKVNIVNIDPAKTAEGVSVEIGDYSLSNSITTEEISVKAESDDTSSDAATTVSIPSGTTFRDKDGQSIQGGTVQAQVVNFDTTDPEALAMFPGNLKAVDIKNEDGSEEEAVLYSAGFTSIDMFVGGTEVKEFTKDIDVTISIDESVVSPNTGMPFKVGDEIPVWTSEEGEGWERHATGTVESVDGKLAVVFKTNHLSWYTLAYAKSSCKYGYVKMVNTGDDAHKKVWISIQDTLTGEYIVDDIAAIGAKGLSSFGYGSTTWKITVYSGQNKNTDVLFESFVPVACTPVTIDLTEQMKEAHEPDVVIDVKGYCGSTLIVPSGPLFMQDPSNDNEWKLMGYVENGKIDLYGVTVGETYTFGVIINGSINEMNITLDSKEIIYDDYVIDDEVCNELPI
ncbi:hypothetical protein [Sediminitomix flava]|uniref:DUF4493 domain-containing protein n=1 Tax=Sediminitomix flava TaxID=379075 RepID=A0A315YW96_SEDFL|nr:hypothetical protein [Sediminitomix flava]PWJ33661.1 hypothetical protein BC781_1128 [Sediminitomix flava]